MKKSNYFEYLINKPVCGGAQNVVRVETQQTFVNWLLGGLTFGIYTPRQARVYCK